MDSHDKRLWAWCKNTLPNIRNCGQATQDRIKKSLKEAGLVAECKHERAKLVQSASGNESWYECEACGEVVS
jgi:hypothetical protein